MAALGYTETGYALPTASAWTIVEVEADSIGQPLNHYVYVYDGAGNLTIYTNKVSTSSVAHTPPATYRIGPNLYDGSGPLVVAYEAKLYDVAWAQSDVDTDYALYFTSSGESFTVYFNSSGSVSNTNTMRIDSLTNASNIGKVSFSSNIPVSNISKSDMVSTATVSNIQKVDTLTVADANNVGKIDMFTGMEALNVGKIDTTSDATVSNSCKINGETISAISNIYKVDVGSLVEVLTENGYKVSFDSEVIVSNTQAQNVLSDTNIVNVLSTFYESNVNVLNNFVVETDSKTTLQNIIATNFATNMVIANEITSQTFSQVTAYDAVSTVVRFDTEVTISNEFTDRFLSEVNVYSESGRWFLSALKMKIGCDRAVWFIRVYGGKRVKKIKNLIRYAGYSYPEKAELTSDCEPLNLSGKEVRLKILTDTPIVIAGDITDAVNGKVEFPGDQLSSLAIGVYTYIVEVDDGTTVIPYQKGKLEVR